MSREIEIKKPEFAELQAIIESSKPHEERFTELLEAAKRAKAAGMTRRETADLFGKLWDLDDAVVAEMEGYIDAILDMICGYCSPKCSLWPGV